MTDVVDRQLRAYNERDVDAFVACYSDAIVIENGKGDVVVNGLDELREYYGPVFADYPDLRANILSRMHVGSYVIDEESVSGGPLGDDVHAVAICRIGDDGSIDHVRFLR